MTKTQTVHKHSSWDVEADSIEQYTCCGHASETPRYVCSSDPAKVTCKRCQFRFADKRPVVNE